MRPSAVRPWWAFAAWLAATLAGCSRDAAAPSDAAVPGPDVAVPADVAPPADLPAADAPATPSLPQPDPAVAGLVAAVDLASVTDDLTSLIGFGTRNACSDPAAPSQGIGAARSFLHRRFAALAGVMVQDDAFTESGCAAGATQQLNVVAWIPGTAHPDRLIVLGGHYDSRGSSTTAGAVDGTLPAPGANDSGSQTAVLLEAARVMAGHPAEATVVFAAFSGEEQGLYGSAAFVRDLATLLPGAHADAMLDCDIVGGDAAANDAAALGRFRLYAAGAPREVGGLPTESPERQGSPDGTSPARGLMRYIGTWGGAYVPAMAMLPHLREDRPGRGGDQESFLAAGIPAVRFIETAENLARQHSPDDTLANMTPAYTARVAQVVVAVAASLARAPAAPPALAVTGDAASSLTLTWTAPPGYAVDHYVIAARPATENLYRRRLSAPAGATHAQLAPAQLGAAGAFFVSVAAVDAGGHESLFAYPEWRCDAAGCAVPARALGVTATRSL